MKYRIALCFVLSLCNNFVHGNNLDFLDDIIAEKSGIVTRVAPAITEKTKKLLSIMKKNPSIQDADDFIERAHDLVSLCSDMGLVREHELYQHSRQLHLAVSAKLYLYYVGCRKKQLLVQSEQHYKALCFWRNQEFYEEQGQAVRLFSTDSYKRKIRKNIEYLEDLVRKTNGLLGLMVHNQQLLQAATTQQEFFKHVRMTIRMQNDFLCAQYGSLSCYDGHDLDVATIIKNSIHQFSQAQYSLSSECAQVVMPSYFARHWDSFTLAVVHTLLTAGVYTQYKHDIIPAAHYFYHEHMKNPVERFFECFAGLHQFQPSPGLDDSKDMIVLDGLIEAEAHSQYEPNGLEVSDRTGLLHAGDALTGGEFRRMCRRVYEGISEADKLNKSWQNFNPAKLFYKADMDPELLAEFAVERPKTQIDPTVLTAEEKRALVQERDNQILANPLKNFDKLLPATERKYLQEMITIKGNVNNVLEHINHIAKETYIVLGMTALIPVMTLTAGTIFALQKLRQSFVYKPIRLLMREVDVFLNEVVRQEHAFEHDGYLYLLTENIRSHTHILTSSEQKLMKADLAALQSSKLDYLQKFNVVQRMYRTYHFLIQALA